MYDNDNISTSFGWGNFRNKLKRMSVHTHKYNMHHQPHDFK